MERRTQAGRRRSVAVEEALAAEVMEVAVSREAGTFFAVGSTARALGVAPGGANGQSNLFMI